MVGFRRRQGQILRHLVLHAGNQWFEHGLRHRLGPRFQAVPDCPIIKKRSITWWSTTSQDSTPGFTEHLRKLPADCFGREKVVLRLQVADKVTDIDPKATSSNYLTALGIEKGTLTPSVAAGNSQARIGTITVRYN